MPLASSHSIFWFSQISPFSISFIQPANQPTSQPACHLYLSKPNIYPGTNTTIHSVTQSFICFSTLPLNYPFTHPAIQAESQSIGHTANEPYALIIIWLLHHIGNLYPNESEASLMPLLRSEEPCRVPSVWKPMVSFHRRRDAT